MRNLISSRTALVAVIALAVGVASGSTVLYWGGTGASALLHLGSRDAASVQPLAVGEVDCPKRPGFTGTATQNDAIDDCTASQDARAALLRAGATSAVVDVSRRESTSLLGPADVRIVHAQTTGLTAKQAHRMARSIARSIDDVQTVYVLDGQLAPLATYDASGQQLTASVNPTLAGSGNPSYK